MPPPREATATAAVAPTDRPLGADVEPIVLPPLDETDALVRRLLGELSSHPSVAAWLATNGLLRNFVVVVENVSIGRTPARLLRALRPAGPFRVAERGEELIIDPGSYERYAPMPAPFSPWMPAVRRNCTRRSSRGSRKPIASWAMRNRSIVRSKARSWRCCRSRSPLVT